MKILVVDDREENRYLLEVLLKGNGYEVVSANNGVQALERLGAESCDMIVSDILMPVMDGFKLCREVKRDVALKHIPFIFYTATYTDEKDEEFALTLGADRFICKPMDPDEFIKIIKSVIREMEKGKIDREKHVSENEEEILQVYSERLVNKLEQKMLALEREITERARAEAEILRLQHLLQDIADSMPSALITLDSAGQVLTWNPAAETLTGQTVDQVQGQSLWQVCPELARYRDLFESVLHEGQVAHQYKERLALGPRIIYRDVSVFPLKAGDLEGAVLRIDDVTQRVQLEEMTIQSAKMASVGQLAGGIAHDFNNIMAVIALYAQMLAQTKGLSLRDQERAATINQQAHHATSLIRQILDFSRQSVLERQALDLLPLLKEQVKLLERTLPENIEIELDYGPALGGAEGPDEASALLLDSTLFIVNADPTRIQQVFMNLAVNARDAMSTGGRLRIGLEHIQVEDAKSAPMPEMQTGEWVRATVADGGSGIPPDVLPHIFEPFFTTKEPGKGTGLGLAQVYGIVTQHEGHIDVSTQVGKGTTFTLYLPALLTAREETPVRKTHNPDVGQGRTLLVVEDNAAVREALRDALESLNYRVLEASDGHEALAVFEQYRGDPSTDPGQGIELVLTDLVMPVMGGQALFYALRQRDLAVKIVLMTGHPLEEKIERLRSEGLVGLLKKPLDLGQLAQVVARALRVQGQRTT